jgi:hypothetical protein
MIEPVQETRNWTFVLDTGCPECGFAAGGLTPADAAARVRSALPGWATVLLGASATERPAPDVWSPVEYAAHVRDLCRLLPARLATMLSFDDPEFADWDQDAASAAYGSLPAAEISADLAAWAGAAAAALEAAPSDGSTLERTGRRSDGTRLTVAELCATLVHEVEHHLRDAGGTPLAAHPADAADDVAQIRAVVARFFAAFASGPDAAQRADDLRAVLLPEAVVVSAAGDSPAAYDVEAFIAPRAALLASGAWEGFREWEVAGRTDVYGDIAQHWCSYAKSWTASGVAARGAGMKSLQLVRTPAGWRISAVAWDDEPR